MAADIAVEKQRAELMDQKIEHERKEADSRGYALEATLKPVARRGLADADDRICTRDGLQDA